MVMSLLLLLSLLMVVVPCRCKRCRSRPGTPQTRTLPSANPVSDIIIEIAKHTHWNSNLDQHNPARNCDLATGQGNNRWTTRSAECSALETIPRTGRMLDLGVPGHQIHSETCTMPGTAI
ncbi:unnamed protein product [Ectocarpus sp. 12 AP-2014]